MPEPSDTVAFPARPLVPYDWTGFGEPPSYRASVVSPCVQSDVNPDAWHPPVGDASQRLAEARYARLQCAGCPLPTKTECLSYAVRTSQTGVWGGTTAQDRAALRSRHEPLAVTVADALAAQDRAAAAEEANAKVLARTGVGPGLPRVASGT